MHGIWTRNDAFQQDKKLITRQIRDRDKRIINPRTSKWMPYWDFASMAALLFTAVATPIEVCFVNDGEVGWFVINLCVNLFFFVDLVMNFFMAYQVAPNKGGVWVTDRHIIVRHYLSTWFLLDLLTVIDFQLIGKGVSGKPIVCGSMVGIACAEAEAEASGTGTLRLIRTLRLLRLVKLLRILRASRIIQRWQDYFGFSYVQLSLGSLVVMLFMFLHWYACLWSYAALGGVWEKTADDLETDSTWVEKMGMEKWLEQGHMASIYMVALHTSLLAMFGGVGSVAPNNFVEYAFLTFILLTGCFFWAYVISTLCSLLATLDPHKTQATGTWANPPRPRRVGS